MTEIAVIQKCVRNFVHCDGLFIPPHPNIAFVEAHGSYRCNGGPIDQYSTICNLHQTLTNFLQLQGCEEIVKTVLLQLAHAVNHIHKNGWAHGKINLSHVYLSRSKDRVVLTHPTQVGHQKATDSNHVKDIQDLRVLFVNLLQMNPRIEDTDSRITQDLLQTMQNGASSSQKILQHPYFWNAERKLNFLSKITQFSKAGEAGKPIKDTLNQRSSEVFSSGCWITMLEISDFEELGEYNKTLQNRMAAKQQSASNHDGNPPRTGATPRVAIKKKRKKKMVGSETIMIFSEEIDKSKDKLKYDKAMLQSLLNFIRNRWEHYWEDSLRVQACFGYNHSAGFWKFFSRRYPKLFPVVYDVIRKSDFKDSGIADVYFETIAENKSLPMLQNPGGEERPMQAD